MKTSDSKVGPGPNYFSNRADDVFVDDDGLHLTITEHGSRWWATEVISDLRVGYGRYEFWLASRVDALDPNAVLGLFTWNNAPDFANREIDIEFARWGRRRRGDQRPVRRPALLDTGKPARLRPACRGPVVPSLRLVA